MVQKYAKNKGVRAHNLVLRSKFAKRGLNLDYQAENILLLCFKLFSTMPVAVLFLKDAMSG